MIKYKYNPNVISAKYGLPILHVMKNGSSECGMINDHDLLVEVGHPAQATALECQKCNWNSPHKLPNKKNVTPFWEIEMMIKTHRRSARWGLVVETARAICCSLDMLKPYKLWGEGVSIQSMIEHFDRPMLDSMNGRVNKYNLLYDAACDLRSIGCMSHNKPIWRITKRITGC